MILGGTAPDPGPGGFPPASLISAPRAAWRYRITPADALVWEALPRELHGTQKALYIGFLLMGGLGFGIASVHLPDWAGSIPSLLQLLILVGLMHGLWMIWMNWRIRVRARQRLPQPQECLLEDWGDHLRFEADGVDRFLAPEMTRQVVPLPTHIFIDDIGGLVILPLSAFAGDAAEMNAFAESWDRRSADAAP